MEQEAHLAISSYVDFGPSSRPDLPHASRGRPKTHAKLAHFLKARKQDEHSYRCRNMFPPVVFGNRFPSQSAEPSRPNSLDAACHPLGRRVASLWGCSLVAVPQAEASIVFSGASRGSLAGS